MRAAAVSALTAALVFANVRVVRAAPKGGAISLDRNTVQVGQRVIVTLSGWAAHNVTLSVCGNLAIRGSGDCNLVASQGLKLLTDPTLTELTIFAPPGTCPCVVRASSAAQDEVAVAPINIIGVPVGPVVGPEFSSLLAVTVSVRSAHQSLIAKLRSAIGGPTSYAVTVSVHNLTTETLPSISVSETAGHSANDSIVSFVVAPPGHMAPGQTWQQVSRVKVPAPALGQIQFHAIASGAGPTVESVAVTNHLPWSFVLTVLIFIIDVIAMVLYFTARRARRRHLEPQGGGEPPDELEPMRADQPPVPDRGDASDDIGVRGLELR